MKTKTATSKLVDAIDHGEAHHERSPWRIRKGKCQVGNPVLSSTGSPIMHKGALRLTWREITTEAAMSLWRSTGWILD